VPLRLARDATRRNTLPRPRTTGRVPAMRQLLLLRHAKSSWESSTLPDYDRPLEQRGRLAAASMRRAMQGLGLQPDLVLVSSARRTLQTLEALEPWDEMPLIEPMDGLYLAGPEQLLKIVRGTPDLVRSVLVVGHNPGLHEFAVTLVGAHGMTLADENARRLAAGYPSGALAEFTVAVPWQRLGEGTGRLVRFVSPKDLPEIA
jgi:phosphohistidine phosphatase